MNETVEKEKERKKRVGVDVAKVSKTSGAKHSVVSCNWLTFINSDHEVLKKSLKDVKMGCNSKESVTSKFCNQPLVTKVLSLDCEMVSDMDNKDMLGRVSIVNYKLQCIYDKFVKPVAPVGDYRTRFSGLREKDLNNGIDFDIVQKEVKHLLRNKILVGHSLGNDFKVLKFKHQWSLIRDTSKYEKFRKINDMRTPSLKMLSEMFLGEDIQKGEHNSVEDARAAMKLYIKFRHEWETSILNQKQKC